MSTSTTDSRELAKFDAIAAEWWDPNGPFAPLHDLNPVRLSFIADLVELAGSHVLDVGCGAGLLSEAMARRGARVTAIDMAEGVLAAARAHAAAELGIEYRREEVTVVADVEPGRYDLLTCLELLEHVPDPAAVIAACATAVRPGGRVFFSTLNRSLRAFGLGIFAAEYLLELLPRGTHEYEKFIRPAELAGAARRAGMDLVAQRGLIYNPFSRQAALGEDPGVNYIACFEKWDREP